MLVPTYLDGDLHAKCGGARSTSSSGPLESKVGTLPFAAPKTPVLAGYRHRDDALSFGLRRLKVKLKRDASDVECDREARHLPVRREVAVFRPARPPGLSMEGGWRRPRAR